MGARPARIIVGDNITAVIANLEKQMREAAEELEFERAGDLRDQIMELQRDVEG